MTTKRFQTSVIVTYSRSNTTKKVSFDTFEEAAKVVERAKRKASHAVRNLMDMYLIVLREGQF